ncbi:hypothetical protein ALQ24_200024 [Pseudomonas syringae pv. antirrhini]|nr:hypothetical protein ALQ24_200024 [Pseudomonas syringae pv. antirrhini]
MNRFGFNQHSGHDHRLGGFHVFLKMRGRNMASIRGFICIDFEEVQPIRMIFFRNRINGQYTWLKANGIGHFLFDCSVIGRQLSRINHKLSDTHNLFHRLTCEHRSPPKTNHSNSSAQDWNSHSSTFDSY